MPISAGVNARRGRSRPSLWIALTLLLDALQEADWRAQKIETFAQTVLEKTLKAEVQPLGLIREDHENRRRGGSLRDVINFHAARRRSGAAIEIGFRKPAIQFAGG